MKNLKIMAMIMVAIGMLIFKSNAILASEVSSNENELYFVVESSETVSY